MKRKPNEKEKNYLRELVGENGTQAHYFKPENPEKARQLRERREKNGAAQVAEMRQVAGSRPTLKQAAREKLKAAAQVIQMRRAAGNFKDPAK